MRVFCASLFKINSKLNCHRDGTFEANTATGHCSTNFPHRILRTHCFLFICFSVRFSLLFFSFTNLARGTFFDTKKRFEIFSCIFGEDTICNEVEGVMHLGSLESMNSGTNGLMYKFPFYYLVYIYYIYIFIL